MDFKCRSPEQCPYYCKIAAFHIHFLVALHVILRKILFKLLITQLMVAWNCTALCVSTIPTLQKIFTSLQNNEITQTGHFIHTQAMCTKFSRQFDFWILIVYSPEANTMCHHGNVLATWQQRENFCLSPPLDLNNRTQSSPARPCKIRRLGKILGTREKSIKPKSIRVTQSNWSWFNSHTTILATWD